MSRVTSHEPNLVTYYIPFKVSAVKTASNKRTVLSEQVRSRSSKVLNWFHGSLHDSSTGASLVILLGLFPSRSLPVPNLGPMGTRLSALGREICLMSGSPSQLRARLIPSLCLAHPLFRSHESFFLSAKKTLLVLIFPLIGLPS